MAPKKEAKSGKGKGPKKHLHQVITTAAPDGSYTHHHVYKAKRDDHDHMAEPARLMATSDNPDEAGEHVTDQFAANQEAQAAPQGQDDGEGAQSAPEEQGAAPEGEEA